MLSYKQIKRENHIIETLTVEHEKFELYESNELGNDEFLNVHIPQKVDCNSCTCSLPLYINSSYLVDYTLLISNIYKWVKRIHYFSFSNNFIVCFN